MCFDLPNNIVSSYSSATRALKRGYLSPVPGISGFALFSVSQVGRLLTSCVVETQQATNCLTVKPCRGVVQYQQTY